MANIDDLLQDGSGQATFWRDQRLTPCERSAAKFARVDYDNGLTLRLAITRRPAPAEAEDRAEETPQLLDQVRFL
jgi:hypothetical protein